MSSMPVPQAPLPVLPLRNAVLFPGLALTLPVGRPASVALVKSLKDGDVLAVAVQLEKHIDQPLRRDLHPIATLARVVKVLPARANTFGLVVKGERRLRLGELTQMSPFLMADVEGVVESVSHPLEAQALAESLIDKLRSLSDGSSTELLRLLTNLDPVSEPGRVADIATGALGLPADKEVEVLLALEVNARLRTAHRVLSELQVLAELKAKVDREVSGELAGRQREMLLRQQLKAIQQELGEGVDEQRDELRQKLESMELPEEARVAVNRELGRLEAMGPEQAEYGPLRRYLEFVAELPWDKRAEVSEDLNAVAAQLDADHYGLQKVKRRILEHLAVRKMTQAQQGTLLCLVGPPGVGKTSLGQSIASATGRPFVRVALGGVRDEADIRGHRRTYVGALPGRILKALSNAKVKNPILLLDEVDKLGQGWMGSPEAALLEVLDPEQNHTFTDHYLDLPFDLSEVMFICTANTLESLSGPFRDRLEIIELEGYTSEEKEHIAFEHLLVRELKRHGIEPHALHITPEAMRVLIADYTREAGVRQLTRELRQICRAVTLEVARSETGERAPVRVDVEDLPHYLGKSKFFNEVAERTSVVGVATGLAWTPAGGDILFVESSRMPGKGNLEITGQLGDVMKESARAALTYVRSNAAALHVDPTFLEGQDLHVHVPAGAVPKDGPSAGVTIFTALTSLLTGRRVRPDTAMTGECTLRGRVLPVGGIKAKVLAAHRAGIKQVILPAKNERDLDDVPASVRDELHFVFAHDMGQVLEAALESEVTPEVTLPRRPAPGVDFGTPAHWGA